MRNGVTYIGLVALMLAIWAVMGGFFFVIPAGLIVLVIFTLRAKRLHVDVRRGLVILWSVLLVGWGLMLMLVLAMPYLRGL